MKKAITSKDSVASFSMLPITSNAEGDVRIVRDVGEQYYWDVSSPTGSLHNWKLLNDMISIIDTREKSAIELENQFISASSAYHKTLTYSGAALTDIDIYVDDTLAIKLFNKNLTYSGDTLTSIVITRMSDGASITKTLGYSGSILSSISVN